MAFGSIPSFEEFLRQRVSRLVSGGQTGPVQMNSPIDYSGGGGGVTANDINGQLGTVKLPADNGQSGSKSLWNQRHLAPGAEFVGPLPEFANQEYGATQQAEHNANARRMYGNRPMSPEPQWFTDRENQLTNFRSAGYGWRGWNNQGMGVVGNDAGHKILVLPPGQKIPSEYTIDDGNMILYKDLPPVVPGVSIDVRTGQVIRPTLDQLMGSGSIGDYGFQARPMGSTPTMGDDLLNADYGEMITDFSREDTAAGHPAIRAANLSGSFNDSKRADKIKKLKKKYGSQKG